LTTCKAAGATVTSSKPELKFTNYLQTSYIRARNICGKQAQIMRPCARVCATSFKLKFPALISHNFL